MDWLTDWQSRWATDQLTTCWRWLNGSPSLWPMPVEDVCGFSAEHLRLQFHLSTVDSSSSRVGIGSLWVIRCSLRVEGSQPREEIKVVSWPHSQKCWCVLSKHSVQDKKTGYKHGPALRLWSHCFPISPEQAWEGKAVTLVTELQEVLTLSCAGGLECIVHSQLNCSKHHWCFWDLQFDCLTTDTIPSANIKIKLLCNIHLQDVALGVQSNALRPSDVKRGIIQFHLMSQKIYIYWVQIIHSRCLC